MARPVPAGGGGGEPRGLVFFLRTPSDAVAAVGTAHTLPLERIVEARQVDFLLLPSGRRAGSSRALLAPPGRPFDAPGGSLARDFLIYALEGPVSGVRVLDAETGASPRPGETVRVLGAGTGRGSDEVSARVARVGADRIDLALDGAPELRGWGGAPVVSAATGRVVGILQAVPPRPGTAVAAPIGGVLRALAEPLAGEAGRPFADFAELATLRRPQPAAGNLNARAEPLLGPPPGEGGVHLRIEYPVDGARVADAGCGIFVAGDATPRGGALRRFDVIFAIDTSASTLDGTGVDINGNGIVGRRLGAPASLLSIEHSDRGDSVLAAEVAAARQLLRELDPRSTRVGVVTFAGGDSSSGLGGLLLQRPPARTVQALTTQFTRVERALDEILSQIPAGRTHIEAGLDQATIELLGLRGALSQHEPRREKVVFFFTDGQPTLPFGPNDPARNVRASLRAADRARRGGIRIHAFATGAEALAGPIVPVEVASRTGGSFTPVRHPGDLVNAVELVDFPELQDVSLRSARTGAAADPFHVGADGAWSGLLRLPPGTNRIEVRALADDGTESRAAVEVSVDGSGAANPIPAGLAARRNALLEECLGELRQQRAATERRRLEQVRRELRLEIERERTRARRRAAEQRKELDLEVEE